MRLYLLTVTDMIFDNDSEVFNDTFTNNQWPVPWWWLSNVHDSDEDSNNNDTDFYSSDTMAIDLRDSKQNKSLQKGSFHLKLRTKLFFYRTGIILKSSISNETVPLNFAKKLVNC